MIALSHYYNVKYIVKLACTYHFYMYWRCLLSCVVFYYTTTNTSIATHFTPRNNSNGNPYRQPHRTWYAELLLQPSALLQAEEYTEKIIPSTLDCNTFYKITTFGYVTFRNSVLLFTDIRYCHIFRSLQFLYLVSLFLFYILKFLFSFLVRRGHYFSLENAIRRSR